VEELALVETPGTVEVVETSVTTPDDDTVLPVELMVTLVLVLVADVDVLDTALRDA
jgi:hypothetical protein